MAGIVGQVERLGRWILDYARQHRLRIWLAGHSAGITWDLITTGLAAGFWTMPGSTAAGSGWQVTVQVLHEIL
jgi:hypothetical protein